LYLPDMGDDPDDDPATPGPRIAMSIGRFPHMAVWDGQPGMARGIEAMIFPNLGKTHTMVTWKGQNFAAFCTDWENQNSPLVNPSAHPEPTPVVDTCGVVVGYYLKKVSTKYLFSTDDGAIFYTGYHLSHPAYSVNTMSMAGIDIYLTPADQPVDITGKNG